MARRWAFAVCMFVACSSQAPHDDDAPLPIAAPPSPAIADPVVLGAAIPAADRIAPDDPAEIELAADDDARVQEVFFGPRDARRVALTFDDGPSRENTPRILDVLAREDVRATFFVLGERAAKMPDLIARVHEHGHEIGNHASSHRSLRSLWASQIHDELAFTNAAVAEVIGRQPAMFRPPFGRYAPSALAIIGQLGMNVVLWSVDAADWNREPAAIAAAVVRETGPGDIVLLHDRSSRTVHALPAIIRGLRERGFELVTVSELTGLPAYR